MPGLREVQYYLAGLWLLIRMDHARLPLSRHVGPRRQPLVLGDRLVPAADGHFLALVASGLPAARCRRMPMSALPFYFRLGLVEMANWFVPLVFAGLLLLAFRMGDRFARRGRQRQLARRAAFLYQRPAAGAGLLHSRRRRARVAPAALLHAGAGLHAGAHSADDLPRSRADGRRADAGAARADDDAWRISAALPRHLSRLRHARCAQAGL